MNKKKIINTSDYVLFVSLLVLASWSAFNSWLPKDTFFSIIYSYFIIRIGTEYIVKKKIKVLFNLNIMLIVLFCFLSILWSDYSWISLKQSISLLMQTFAVMFIVSKYEMKKFILLLVIAAIIITISSYYVAIFMPSEGINQYKFYGAWQGVFEHKNNLASVMVVYLIMELYFLSLGKKMLMRMLIIILAISQIILIVLSQSTTGIILLICTVLLFVILKIYSTMENPYLKISYSVLILIYIIIGLVLLFLNLSYVFNLFGKDITFTGRNVIWNAGINLINEKWLVGYGYRSTMIDNSYFFNSFVSQIGFKVGSLHNGYLETLSYIGYVGSILIILSIGLYFIRSMKWFLLNDNFSYLSLIFLVYLLVLNFQESAFLGSQFSLMWMIYVYIHLNLKKC